MAQALNPEGLHHYTGAAYSNAAWAPPGRLLFIAGQVATGPQGEIIGEGNIKEQTRAVLRKIGAILDSAGGTFDDVVSVTVFITTMDGFADIHEARREFFKPPYPASTMVEVRRLVDPRLMIEINAVAVISG